MTPRLGASGNPTTLLAEAIPDGRQEQRDAWRDGHGAQGAGLHRLRRRVKNRMSDGFVLEDVMQRKQHVPEEARSEARTIHRMAPPGLKGYMGAEYSNDFFTYYYAKDKMSEAAAPRPMGNKVKVVAQKRMEEEVADQVALVERLHQPLDDAESDDEESGYCAAES